MIEDTEYTVYKHTAPNGKVYIGITKQKPDRRWRNGDGYKHNKHFYSAILKYDWENIKHEIVENGLTKEQACNLEIELIAKYDATNPKHGYNNTMGGETNIPSKETRGKFSEANKGKHHSPETRKKMSESRKGVNNPNFGKHLSAETRQKISESLKCTYINHPELLLKFSESKKGIHLSADHRQKISEANKGKIPQNAWKKGCIPWNKGKHLSAETRRKISESSKGKHLSAETRRKIGESSAKAVICVETGILYNSATEAEKSIGISRGTISNVLRGKSKTAGGYHWKYAEAQSLERQ